MKIRYGFVTNSSSSSFVIAKKSDVDINHLAQYIYKNGLLGYIIENIEYIDIPNDIKEAYENDDIKFEEMLAMYLAEELTSFDSDMKLGDWIVSGGEASNETKDLVDFFIYNQGGIDFEDFKITTIR